MSEKVYEVCIETGFMMPSGDSDAVVFNMSDKEFMNKLIDLATEHGYKVTIEAANQK